MQPVRQQIDHWRGVLDQAFRDHSFELEFHPVVGLQGELVHYEAPMRLKSNGENLAAGHFLPWVNRLQLSSELDREVVELALKSIESTGRPTAINLSVAAVHDSAFISWIGERLTTHREAASHLCMEVPEAMAFRHLKHFKMLCGRVRSSGCKTGIKNVGHQLSGLGNLQDVGLDYLKIDAGFVRGIDDNLANQTLVRALCGVGHSIGVTVYAEGVRTEEEWAALQELGADGATGPGIEL
jgi:EAL domain-containing protein (putative c-di-GMP-specific phosphodiesterase class I)